MSWWSHKIETLSLLALCEGNPPVTGGSVIWCSFYVSLHIQLNKLSWCRWIKMSRRSFDVVIMMTSKAARKNISVALLPALGLLILWSNHPSEHLHDDVITFSSLTFSALLALCVGNSLVTGEFPSRRPVTRSSDFFSCICAWINGWVNNRETDDLRRNFVR